MEMPIGAGRPATRLAGLSSACLSSESFVMGNTSQDCSKKTEGTSDNTMVALQTMVSLAPNPAGGQTKAASVQEGSVIPAGQSYLASRSILSTVMGLAFGTNPLLADCEPSVIHTVLNAKAACTRQLYTYR